MYEEIFSKQPVPDEHLERAHFTSLFRERTKVHKTIDALPLRNVDPFHMFVCVILMVGYVILIQSFFPIELQETTSSSLKPA